MAAECAAEARAARIRPLQVTQEEAGTNSHRGVLDQPSDAHDRLPRPQAGGPGTLRADALSARLSLPDLSSP